MRKISFFIILILFVIFSIFITNFEDKFEVLAIGNILHSNYEYKASDLTQNDNIANMSELNAFNRGSLILGE